MLGAIYTFNEKMKRSVIQLAGRTLLVSLPAKWADANNVKKGNELDVVEDGHRLLVNTEKISEIEKAELNSDEVGSSIRRFIFTLYKKGIDEINIRYSDPKIGDIIRDTLLTQTVGYEIISQTPKGCVVKLITSGVVTEFDNLLRRTFLMLLSMSEEVYSAIKSNNYEQLPKIALLEASNNRLTAVCRRYLNKRGSDTYSKAGPIYVIVENLEKLADEYKHFCKNVHRVMKNNDMEIKPEVLSLFEKTNETLRTFYELFYKMDLKKITLIEENRKVFMKEAHKFIETKKLNPAEFYTIHHSVSILELIFNLTGPFLVLTV